MSPMSVTSVDSTGPAQSAGRWRRARTDGGPRRIVPKDRRAWPYSVLTFILFAAAWEIFASQNVGILIPTFSETVSTLASQLTDPVVWSAFVVSNQALVIGFVASVAIGVPLGLLLGRFRRADRLLDVYLDILLVMPMAALLPIMVMVTGIGLTSRVLIVILFAIVYIIVNTRAGVRQVPPSLIEMAQNMGANERQVWRKILLPSALPAIMTGVRLGLGRAITGMIIVELLMVSVGMGGLMIEYRAMFNGGGLYGLVIIVVVEALVLISLVKMIERRIIPYARAPKGLS